MLPRKKKKKNRARKHVTPHGSLFVDKPNSSTGWKSEGAKNEAGAAAAYLPPSSKLPCLGIVWLAPRS